MALTQHLYQQLCRFLHHSPTPCQEELFGQFADYMVSDNTDELFVVNGYAGTGKSTAVGAIVKLMDELKIEVVLMAPTGRSAKVLSGYAQRSAYTIHKTIYREKNPGSPAPHFVLDFNKAKDTLFLVDEASLISNQSAESSVFGSGRLFDDLVHYVRSGIRNRLFIMGDGAQLPPVGLSSSPALDRVVLGAYGNFRYIEMTSVVRQAAGSGILYNATLLREKINTGMEGLPSLSLGGYHDIFSLKGGALMETLQGAYDRYGIDETVILCRSNKRANRYNDGIRSRILFCEEELNRGDRVMVVKNCYQFLEDAGEELPFIANGDVAEILRINKHEERYGFHFAQAKLRFPDYNDLELEAKVLLDTLHLETPSLGMERQGQLFSEILLNYAHIRGRRKQYMAVREDLYYNALQLKYAAALTTHKAQGGQWKAVFVDYSFFGDVHHSVEDLRWFYTAFTRATEVLYLVNFPLVHSVLEYRSDSRLEADEADLQSMLSC
ncbi:MAG: AAA family ATPase [Bacteroidetes bacterium]|nr:AAA family ATPase [Bacteroidota bacterium]